MDGWMDRSLLPRYELSPVASIYFTYHYTRIFTGKKKRIKWYFIQIHLISPPPLKISWKYKGGGESNKIVERNTTRMTLCLYSSIYIFQSFVQVYINRLKTFSFSLLFFYIGISYPWDDRFLCLHRKRKKTWRFASVTWHRNTCKRFMDFPLSRSKSNVRVRGSQRTGIKWLTILRSIEISIELLARHREREKERKYTRA